MMKKALTSIFAVILLVSGMQITLDRHYCGGSLADIRISFTGKMASCGMEQSEPDRPDYPIIDNKCCEDQLFFYKISSNYYPEYFKLAQLTSEREIIPIHTNNFITDNSYNQNLVQWIFPPGYNLWSSLTQSEICVFRI
jgi:hypothetical protein